MRAGTLERVYYFHGDDDFLKDALAREFIAAAIPAAARDFDCEVLRGAEASAEALETAFETPPLLHARRLVVIRDVHALRRDARRTLSAYLKRPSPTTVVLLVQRAGDKASPELRDAAVTVEFQPLAADRIPRWIEHYAKSELGTTIAPEATSLLQNVVGDDVPQLAAELAKLASHAGEGGIIPADVEAVVGVRHVESLGALLDAVADRDSALATRLAGAVLAQPKTSLVSVLMALTTQTLAMASGRAALDRGVPRGGLQPYFFGMLRESRVFPGRAWGEAAGCWTRAVTQWSAADLEDGLHVLLQADRAAKDVRITDDEHALCTVIASLCAGRRRAAA
jgi:DNA polymerase-3 subunit delta